MNAGQLKKKRAVMAPMWNIPNAVSETQLMPSLLIRDGALPLVVLRFLNETGRHFAPRMHCYQRLFLPPPPPLLRYPPSPRSSFARASFTLSALPSNSWPFRAAMAFVPSPSLPISTNAKPLARPESRSVTTFTRSTVPCASKRDRSPSSVAPKLRFPTNIFFN